jgi:Ca-activated chloride channel family protein
MKKYIIIILLIIFDFTSYAKNSFKEGNELYLKGKYQDALKEYGEFINKNNDYYEGYYNAGNAYFRMGDYQKALEMYKKAYELNSKDEDVVHNMKVAEEKLKQQQQQSQCNKNQSDKNQNNQQNQKQQQGQSQNNNQNQQSQANQQNQQYNQQQAQQNNAQQQNRQKQSSGMSDDEVQALLNMKKKQELQLRQYFGNQYRKKNQEDDFPDFFNMSPAEIMRYMEQRMMDPFSEFEPKKNRSGSGDKKDW